MSNYTISPNMNLPVPIVGVDPGPEYAVDVNSALTLVDSHDHSIGYGVQIQPAGLNISSDLTFHSNRAVNVAALALVVQSSSPGAMNLFSMPAGTSPVANELFYTDNNGVTTQITSNGIVNTTASAIEGETYNTATGTFIWTQTQSGFPTTPANFSIASLTLAPAIASTSVALTLMPPSGLSGAASITLPLTSGLSNPAFLTITTGGVMSPSVSTVGGISGSNIASATITNTNIAANTITGGASGNIGLATITQANIAPGSFGVTTNGYAFNTTVTIPAGVVYVQATVCGGGGGGGGGYGDSVRVSGGGGGGGGSIPQQIGFQVTAGDVLTLTVGAGGAGGTSFFNGGNPGAAGGSTQLYKNGTLLITSYQSLGGAGGTAQAGGNSAGASSYPLILRTGGGYGGGNLVAGGAGDFSSFGQPGGGGIQAYGGGGGGGGAGYGNGGDGGYGSGASGLPGGNGFSPVGYGCGGGGGGGGYDSLGGTGANGTSGVIFLSLISLL